MNEHKSLYNICAAVVIGRNEGQRLKVCLESLIDSVFVVYVDSGSTDHSVELARALGADVIALDMTQPFTAARARNAGAQFLLENRAEIEYIQFVDADCEVHPSWLQAGIQFLQQNENYAVACGRRRERYPAASLYNRLCDIEWNTPVGLSQSCGGDALIRVNAFRQAHGYNDTLVAGEEPEMCFRMRQNNWKVMRLANEMTLHDAAMTHFSQWWKRSKRTGFAYFSGYGLHGHSSERFRYKEVQRIVLWGAILPLLLVGLLCFSLSFLWFFSIYPLQLIRLYRNYIRVDMGKVDSFLYAVSNLIGKFPQLLGGINYLLIKFRKRQATLIEYK